MNVTCKACLASYAVPDDKVRGRRVKTHCKQCQAEMIVDGTALGSAPGAASRSAPRAAPGPALAKAPEAPRAPFQPPPVIPKLSIDTGDDDVTRIGRRGPLPNLAASPHDEPTVIGQAPPELLEALRSAYRENLKAPTAPNDEANGSAALAVAPADESSASPDAGAGEVDRLLAHAGAEVGADEPRSHERPISTSPPPSKEQDEPTVIIPRDDPPAKDESDTRPSLRLRAAVEFSTPLAQPQQPPPRERDEVTENRRRRGPSLGLVVGILLLVVAISSVLAWKLGPAKSLPFGQAMSSLAKRVGDQVR